MKRIINGIEYQIPKSWEDISLEKYLEVMNVDVDEDEEFRSLIIIGHYTGIPVVELKRMKLTELHELLNVMKFLQTDIAEDKPIENIIISGETYHVIESMLTEQAQDYFAMDAMLREAQHNIYNAMPKLLAIMLRKSGENLDEINIDQRTAFFKKNVNVVQANGLRVFFYNYGIMLQLHSQLYSNRNQIIHQKELEVENTMKRLDGMGWRGRWLKKILQKLLKFYTNHWKNYYSGTVSNSKKTSISKTYRKSKTKKRE